MTATDELRRMLDERGVEYEGETDEDGWAFTRWHGFDDTGWLAASDELCGLLDLRGRYLFTPEQAIEATLGRGTCHIVKKWSDSDFVDGWRYRCSECMCFIPVNERDPETGDVISAANYCPNCGARVVSE